MRKHAILSIVAGILLLCPSVNATNERDMKTLLNADWQFHLGELPAQEIPKKLTTKAGFTGGASILTRAEGVRLTPPGIFAQIIGGDPEFLYSFYNVVPTLSAGWEKVDLPHDWMFRQPYQAPANMPAGFNMDTPAGNGYLPDNVGYYRKQLTVPAEAEGKRVSIEFEGVMHDCDIWINGHYIGNHYSGYTGFDFDVTEYLEYGSDQNVILVKTASKGREGWWYDGAGIYRNVWMAVHGTLGFKREGIFAKINPAANRTFDLELISELINNYPEDKSFTLYYEILDPQGKSVEKGNKDFTIPALAEENFAHKIHLDQPVLWDLDQPNLYTAQVRIVCDGTTEEEMQTRFGLRTIEYTQEGLFLNGRWVELKGVCEHQDFAGVGIALTEDIMEYKVKRLKDMGVNAYRSSHHPATRAFLDICDREGILVLNENRNFMVNPVTLADLRDLVVSSRNHPSVFMYCLENEEMITPTKQGKAILRRIKDLVKHMDPTRMITMAGMAAKEDPEYVTIPDVAGFNYDDQDAAMHVRNIPGIRVMGTEDASFLSTRGVYIDDLKQGWCSAYDSGSYMWAIMAKDEEKDVDKGTFGGMTSHGSLEYAWKHNRVDVPQLGGLFLWTAFDYRGEPSPTYWPQIGANFGAMDMCGFEKDAFYYWKGVWSDEPLAHVLPYWTFPGKEGQKIKVETYSNCEEVELFVNNVSQGKKKNNRGDIGKWEVIYQPGEIKLVAYNRGKAVAESVRKTFGTIAELRLETVWQGKEMTLVKVAAYDKNGLLCENCNEEVKFTVTGGEFVGVANGNPSSHEPDYLPQRKLFNGLAMIIIRHDAQGKAGVTATIDNRFEAVLR
ncbi:beta-galactosidase [Parabacteroides sp. PF5-6]|nr:beta-galactosidase [Parabacteroides sp. PF5-6]